MQLAGLQPLKSFQVSVVSFNRASGCTSPGEVVAGLLNCSFHEATCDHRVLRSAVDACESLCRMFLNKQTTRPAAKIYKAAPRRIVTTQGAVLRDILSNDGHKH